MKKILVPCDFSTTSIEALKFSAALARRTKAEIHLVHAIELPALYNSEVVLEFERMYMDDREAAGERKAGRLLERWAKGLRTNTIIEFGGTIKVIQKAIKRTGADLIVMGTHGASGIKEYSIGSNAEKTVRRSSIPVIVLKKAVLQIKNIVFPISPYGSEKELVGVVNELQRLFNAKLHVLVVNTPAIFHRDLDIMPKLESFAARNGLKNYSLNIYNDTDEVEGIIHFTNTIDSPLVAMRTRGRIGLTHLANGSIAEDVVNHIKCPVWTFKTK